jgi:hypothetical protein
MPLKANITTLLTAATISRLGKDTSIANLDSQVVIRGQL